MTSPLVAFSPFGRPVDRTRAQALQLEDSARLRRYRDALAFYEGRHFATPRRGRSALVVNYARAIVDKGVSFLIGRGVGFAVEPTPPNPPSLKGRGERGDAVAPDEMLVESSGQASTAQSSPFPLGRDAEYCERHGAGGVGRAQAAEALLYQVYDDNDLEQVDLACATNAAVLGDGVYKVFWEAPTAEHAGQIRVVSVDPLGFFARWRADDLATLQRVDLAYTIAAADAEALYGVRIGFSARGPEGVEIVESWTATSFCLAVAGRELQAGPNPYGVIPFVHVPNLPSPNEFWGRSDLVDVIPLNRELNERLSDQADVIRYHADPPVVFRGVEDHDAITVGPGSVWDLPRDADVKLLEWQGQPVAVQEHINQVLRMLYEVAETPRTAFGDSGRLLSGVALETELRPLIQKTLRKRSIWSAALRRRARLVWQIAERVGLAAPGSFADLRPRVIWPSMMPQDDAQDVRNNVLLVGAGLRSQRTALDLLGAESPEVELARIRTERAAPAPAAR